MNQNTNVDIKSILLQLQLTQIIHAVILIILGFIIASIVSNSLNKVLHKYLSRHTLILTKRTSYYFILTLFFISALQHLGFSLSVFLGAAGVLTVAIGFASQLSFSNLISGFFLIAEKPFVIGDTISLDSVTGEVISIDPLSIKLRLSDNTLARIPNETLIKANVINLSHFPTRRFDLNIGVAYKEDLENVRSILLNVAKKNKFCLKEPEAKVSFVTFGDSSINLQFSVWATRENYNDVKTIIPEEVKLAFEKHNIEIPFPTRSVYPGTNTQAIPIKIINEKT